MHNAKSLNEKILNNHSESLTKIANDLIDSIKEQFALIEDKITICSWDDICATASSDSYVDKNDIIPIVNAYLADYGCIIKELSSLKSSEILHARNKFGFGSPNLYSMSIQPIDEDIIITPPSEK